MILLIIKGICILVLLIFLGLIIRSLAYLYEEDYKRHKFKLFIIAVLFIQIHITFGYVLGTFFNIPALSLLPLAFGIAIIWKSIKRVGIQKLMQHLLFFIGIFLSLFLFLFVLDNFLFGEPALGKLPNGILKQWKYFFYGLTSLF